MNTFKMQLCGPCSLILVFHDVHPPLQSVPRAHTQTHTNAHTGTYWNSAGPRSGKFCPYMSKGGNKPGVCVWLAHRWNERFSEYTKKTHAYTRHMHAHKCSNGLLVLCAHTQTKQLLALWCLTYAAKLSTAQSACEWQTCVSDLLLHKQRRVMRKGKYGKEKKECVKW